MQKVIVLFLILLSFGCEVGEEVFLYDEDSPEYQDLLELEQQICKANPIFTAMNNSKAFQTYGYEANTIYRVEGSTDANIESYIKITSVDDTTLVFHHHCSSGCTPVDSQVTVTQAMMDDFIEAIQEGVCALDKDFRYSSSGLSSSTSMIFSDFRETEVRDSDGNLTSFIYKTDTYRVNLEYPLAFVLYNYTRNIKENDEADENHVFNITEIDQDECDDEAKCDFTSTPSAVTPVIDTDAYVSDAIGNVPFSISSFPNP